MIYLVTIGIALMVFIWIFGMILLGTTIDASVAVIYGIYGLIIIIFWIFVLIGLKQGLIIG